MTNALFLVSVLADEASSPRPVRHVKVTGVYKADLVTSEGKEASLFLAELGPGANMGKHYHPGDAFAYILEKPMLLEIVGKDSVTLKPRQRGSLPPQTVHDDKNASQIAPLKFLVFHVAQKGVPLAVPEGRALRFKPRKKLTGTETVVQRGRPNNSTGGEQRSAFRTEPALRSRATRTSGASASTAIPWIVARDRIRAYASR
jgi:quercetin dioxygenase-like cupin family protein